MDIEYHEQSNAINVKTITSTKQNKQLNGKLIDNIKFQSLISFSHFPLA